MKDFMDLIQGKGRSYNTVQTGPSVWLVNLIGPHDRVIASLQVSNKESAEIIGAQWSVNPPRQ